MFSAAIVALEEALQWNCADADALKPPVNRIDSEQAQRLDATARGNV
jgi:hypothetical protein